MNFDALSWLFTGLLGLIWFLMLNSSLSYRFSRPITYVSELLWHILTTILNLSLPFMGLMRMFFGCAEIVILCLVLFKDPWPKVLFVATMVPLLNITNELIGVGLYFPPEVLAGTSELLSPMGKLLFYGPYLLSAAVLFSIFYLFLNRLKFSLTAKDWLLFALFPASQYVLMFGWLDALRLAENDSRALFFMLVMIACLAADVALFQAIQHIAQRAQLAAENSQLAIQVEAQEKHYADLTAQYEDIRRMRHDIANHLNAMQAMLESGHSGEAAAYISELTAKPYDESLGLCEHPVVDAFLHNKLESAGVQVQAQVSLRAGLPVSNVDLIRAFGNLLDNAFEACAGIDNASVSLKCMESHGCLVIVTENPRLDKPADKKRRIPGLERGIGTRVLTELAAKYDGSFKQTELPGMHRAEFVLRIGAED